MAISPGSKAHPSVSLSGMVVLPSLTATLLGSGGTTARKKVHESGARWVSVYCTRPQLTTQADGAPVPSGCPAPVGVPPSSAPAPPAPLTSPAACCELHAASPRQSAASRPTHRTFPPGARIQRFY